MIQCLAMSARRRVCKSTNVSLNADVSLAVQERQVRWTTYANLDAWFGNFWAFLIEFDFAGIGEDDGKTTPPTLTPV